MTDFSRLDSADNFLAAVTGYIRRRAMSTGLVSWSSDPALRETRERSCRILVRAVNRRERAASDLRSAGVPEKVVRGRLHANAEARTSRALARHR